MQDANHFKRLLLKAAPDLVHLAMDHIEKNADPFLMESVVFQASLDVVAASGLIEELDREPEKPQRQHPSYHPLNNFVNYETRQYTALARVQETLRIEQRKLEQKAPRPESAGKARDLQSPKKGLLSPSHKSHRRLDRHVQFESELPGATPRTQYSGNASRSGRRLDDERTTDGPGRRPRSPPSSSQESRPPSLNPTRRSSPPRQSQPHTSGPAQRRAPSPPGQSRPHPSRPAQRRAPSPPGESRPNPSRSTQPPPSSPLQPSRPHLSSRPLRSPSQPTLQETRPQAPPSQRPHPTAPQASRPRSSPFGESAQANPSTRQRHQAQARLPPREEPSPPRRISYSRTSGRISASRRFSSDGRRG